MMHRLCAGITRDEDEDEDEDEHEDEPGDEDGDEYDEEWRGIWRWTWSEDEYEHVKGKTDGYIWAADWAKVSIECKADA